MAYHAPTYLEIHGILRDFLVSLPPQLIIDSTPKQAADRGNAEDLGEYVPVITESDIDPLARRITELANSKENDNAFFLDSNLDKEFRDIKALLLSIDKDRAVTFLKACKVLLAMIQKGPGGVS